MERRITRELDKMKASPPPMVSIQEGDIVSGTEWLLTLKYEDGSCIYQGKEFKLRFKFGPKYPMDSPEVVFVGSVPIHEHIYSNGHICMDILYDAWTPAMTVATVAQSIASMLAGMFHKSQRKLTEVKKGGYERLRFHNLFAFYLE